MPPRPLDDDETPIRTRPVKTGVALPVVVAVGIACLVVGLALGAGVTLVLKGGAGGGLFGLSESNEGAKWTLNDFLNHVDAKGVKFSLVGQMGGVMGIAPHSTICEPQHSGQDAPSAVTIWQFDTPQKAKEYAGNSQSSRPWGRFVVDARRPESHKLAASVWVALGNAK